MIPRAAQLLLGFIYGLSALQTIAAHGWIKEPASRNLMAQGEGGFYQHMSLNRPGAAITGGVCGGEYPGDARFSVGGEFASRAVAASWTEGSTVEVAIQIYINHWGRFEMRLCPLSADSDAAEAAELSEECLSQHVLTLADGSGPYYYVKGGNDAEFLVDQRWKLPDGVSCERCVLQWRYVTAHECLPPGVDISYAKQNYMAYPTFCGPDYLDYSRYTNPEKFWNCADVKIRRNPNVIIGAVASLRKFLTPISKKMKAGAMTKANMIARTSPSGASCSDITPPQGFSCKMQKAWGKCDAAWMTAGDFCKQSCGRCGGAVLEVSAPSEAQRMSVSRVTATPAQNWDAAVTTRFGQCGGGYGGNRCPALPDGSPRCADAAWPWTACPAGTSCVRVNHSYWQCM